MMPLLLAALAAATPAPRLLLLDLEAVSVSADDAKALDRVVLAELTKVRTVEVVSAEEIRRLAALESEKQSVGCDDEGCLAELAGAMGARLVVFGSVSRLGPTTTLTLSLYDADARGNIRRAAVDAPSPADLAPKIGGAVHDLLAPAGLVAEAPPAPAPKPIAPIVWIGGATAGAGLVVASLAAVGVGVAEAQVQEPERDAAQKRNAQTLGRLAIAGSAAGVLLATAGVGAVVWGLVE